MGYWNTNRLLRYADQFGFTDDTISRKKYQRRFAFCLSLTFGLLCLQLLTGLLFLLALDVDLTRQLATKNALFLWLSLIPTHFLALLLLLIFYKYCHVWKKEGVAVGFAYDDSFEVSECVKKAKFKGFWVTHTKSQKESNAEIPKQEAESIISSSAISNAGEEGNAEQLDPVIQADLTPESPDIGDSTDMTPPQRGESAGE